MGNLSELVYKQGQAGVTKASVTVVFNNDNKSCSPVGYEMHDRITITRQIVIGGRNRYLLNSHNVQQNQIQNLFHSVSLNVNNPHFLIMQGRITKVINMKHQETLGMIEEAAGTRMYENKKAGALRTLEKKQNKVDEINKLLAEEITPTLEKLQKERANYMRWVSNNNEMERLQRFVIAYEYVQLKDRAENKNQQLDEMEAALKMLGTSMNELDDREVTIQREIKQRAVSRDKNKANLLKQMEEDHSKLSKEMAQIESKLKNRTSDLEGQVKARKKNHTALDEMKKQIEAKDKGYAKEKAKWDTLVEQEASVKQEIEKAQWSIQALTAGMSTQKAPDQEGEGKSLREHFLEAQTRLSELESDKQKKTLAVTSLKQRIGAATELVAKSKQDGKRLLKEKSAAEAFIQEKKDEMGKLSFDPQNYADVNAKAQQGGAQLEQITQRLDSLRAQLGGIDFRYADPYKGFDRSTVKGVVSKLFHVNPDFSAYHRALEVCAGGRLFFVVTDNEETGKALLDKGQLRRRVTIIPLNKIVDPSIPQNTVKQARRVMPEGGELHLAMEIIGFDSQVQNAMKYVFGGFLVCDTSETAKQVTFHPNVRVRSVTRDGDLYDPAGTITGGSAPKGGNILMRLQELADMEKKVEVQQQEYQKAKAQLARLQAASQQYMAFEKELKCKEHEYSLIEERISRSEHHEAEKVVQESQAQIAQLETEIKNLPEVRKTLEKTTKDLEKEIKSLENGREGRIKHLHQQIEQLQVTHKQHLHQLEKHRERNEQITVEMEVMKTELQSHESQDQAAGEGDKSLEEEVEALKTQLQTQNASLEELAKTIAALQAEIRELDTGVQVLEAELKTNRQQKEEKELEQKRTNHKIQQMQNDDKESHLVVQRLEQQYAWIEKEKAFFGKAGTDFDFKANDYKSNKSNLETLNAQQNKLSKNINKKAMAMFEKAEQEYKDLLQKRDIILNDKAKIEDVIRDLDDKKGETLRRTWVKVNRDFNSIFGTLLPHASAKLEPPEGMDASEGLEIKVGFHDVWKQSLTELSGGQRSLLALSLVLALLLFKPAPMYILDEIDSALDLSHTQNIGHMIRTHFPHSQFIVVSLKEGMFNHANVLFRTRFMDGTSNVTRYAIRDKDDRVAAPKDGQQNEFGGAKKKQKV